MSGNHFDICLEWHEQIQVWLSQGCYRPNLKYNSLIVSVEEDDCW
jgi:hypothetical protein